MNKAKLSCRPTLLFCFCLVFFCWNIDLIKQMQKNVRCITTNQILPPITFSLSEKPKELNQAKIVFGTHEFSSKYPYY